MKKRFLFGLLMLLLLSTYNIQKNFNLSSILLIKNVEIENNSILDEKKIKNKLSFAYQTNLFFLNNKSIETKLNELEFIESFKIKKIYPNELKIEIYEKTPVAIIQNKKEKKYFTQNGDLINFVDLGKFSNLPLVFGDGKSFSILYKNLKEMQFPLNDIKIFYLFESKRWDLLTYKNQTIKLPINDYDSSLKNFINIINLSSFENYKTFDYRIKDQLILK